MAASVNERKLGKESKTDKVHKTENDSISARTNSKVALAAVHAHSKKPIRNLKILNLKTRQAIPSTK